MNIDTVMDENNRELVSHTKGLVQVDLDIVEAAMEEFRQLTEDLMKGRVKPDITELYRLGEKVLAPYQHYASCSKGCSNCCFLNVEIARIELENIRNYIDKNFSSKEKFNLHKKAGENAKKSGPVEGYEAIINYANLGIPCIFLSEDKTCRIYEVRPWGCRRYFSVKNPELCKPGGTGTFSVSGLEFYMEYILGILLTQDEDCLRPVKNLNEWFK